jgi:hypothetical protein
MGRHGETLHAAAGDGAVALQTARQVTVTRRAEPTWTSRERE